MEGPMILRLPEVCKTTGLSKTTIWRMVKAGTFPPPVQLSPRAVGWRRSDIEKWLENRPAVACSHPLPERGIPV